MGLLASLTMSKGTVTTAFLMSLPRKVSATDFILPALVVTWTMGLLASLTMSKGTSFLSAWTDLSEKLRPMRRLTSKTVFSGLMVAWFLAASPTRRSELSMKATYEGVIRLPWSLAMISTRPFLNTPTQEYVVPRSIPITVPIDSSSSARAANGEAINANVAIASLAKYIVQVFYLLIYFRWNLEMYVLIFY